jgi:hypothetical protein
LLLGLGLPLACGGGAASGLFADDTSAASDFLREDDARPSSTQKAAAVALTFPGGGSSGAAQPLNAGLGPETSTACDPEASATTGTAAQVHHVCFFAEDDPTTLAATIEQVVEVVGTDEWVHLRLTLGPDFVDNTYGQTAIGWAEEQGPRPPKPAPMAPPQADAKPAKPAPMAPMADPEPPVADPTRQPPERPAPPPGAPGATPSPPDAHAPRPGPGGHTFRDLVGSDHAEIQLLDADGQIAMEFWLDYLSASDAAPSDYASLGVSGGEGRISVGDPDWILASSSSMDRNLNACGLGDFLTDSPETDENYTPNPAASDWDYRVSYEAWISSEAFADAGFGSALIELVHASPSKHGGNSLNVLPAPCPVDPANPEATPEPLPPVLSTIR